MSSTYKEEVEKNRKYMLIINAVKFLAHQGSNIRGHNKNKESLNQVISKKYAVC